MITVEGIWKEDVNLVDEEKKQQAGDRPPTEEYGE